ncbi:TPA: acyltransferase [Klebsiella quasipneumoniae]|uniref:acyltransferase family protein n=1 Tax=Klebsiella quasipneumoniae TaxID=1463165 RepID=UPI002275D684|nr:acyltransferase family protein [Klebsiella quasipneumoniae]MDZ3403185.1 acyltransferase [Klebsiella quasipneumoniae]HEB4967971.1 acyltransferase [Klebsiella quasipneumoniae]
MKNNGFRYDINGLRAYAVILVVLFHFGVTGFSAGFVGVDIFFVISGFLMTKIISDRLLDNSFSLMDFISSRAIRILPALLVMTLVVCLIGWFLLEPSEYKKYGAYAASSIVFSSNILYWKKTGDYFSTDSHDIPLLHTWSLSVEWQFYLLLPIFLWLVTRVKNRKEVIQVSIVFLFIISFLLLCFFSENNQTFSFFMLPMRAWEMAAGGLVYLIFNNVNFNKLNPLGLILILVSLCTASRGYSWPGYLTLLPVIGTMLVLIARNGNSIFFRLKAIQKVGDWSYSIYLWHWPIVFFISYLDIKNTYSSFFGVILSIILGMISFKFIETPTRKLSTKLGFVKSLIYISISVVILFLIYSLIFYKQGFISRADGVFIAKTENIKMPRTNDGWCFYDFSNDSSLVVGSKKAQECFLGSSSKTARKALLIGDSFAGHNSPFWDYIGKDLNISVQGVSTNWCYPSLNGDYTGRKGSVEYKQCLLNRGFLINNFKNYDYIILAGMWSSVFDKNQIENLNELTKFLVKNNKKVIIMDEPYAFDKKIADIYKRKLWLDQRFSINPYLDNDREKGQVNLSNVIGDILKDNHVFLISRESLFSKDQVTSQNIPYSLDGVHISVYGSIESSKFFEKQHRYKDLINFMK